MALTKSTFIKSQGRDLPYIKIEKVVRIHEKARDAEFNFSAYASKEAADTAEIEGCHVGVLRFLTAAFDVYFSKQALQKASGDVYGQCYQAAKDWSVANAIRRSKEDIVKNCNLAVASAQEMVQAARVAQPISKPAVDAANTALNTASTALKGAIKELENCLTPEQQILVLYGHVNGPMGETVLNGATDVLET